MRRFEKRHKNTPVHVSPAFRLKQGDEIRRKKFSSRSHNTVGDNVLDRSVRRAKRRARSQ